MKMKEWKYRFYEDEDTDLLDEIDALDNSEADDAISMIDSWKNTKDNSISQSQIQSLVKSEIQRQMKSGSVGKTGEASKEHQDTTADKGAEEHSLYQQRLEQQGNKQQAPHHKAPSKIDLHLPKKGHRHKGKGRHINSQPRAKVPSKPHYDVVYRELERVCIYPLNRGPLIPFNHSILGNYVLFSPIWGTDTADTNMKRVHRLMTSLFNFKHHFLPIYTYDKGELIDISFIIFPRDDDEKAFANLIAIVKAISKRQQTGISYVECVDGFHTLITESQKVHYAFGDLDKILDNYTRDRGVGVMGGLNILIHPKHYLNPYPQSLKECLYRSKTGEIWKGRIQVKSV